MTNFAVVSGVGINWVDCIYMYAFIKSMQINKNDEYNFKRSVNLILSIQHSFEIKVKF